MLDPAHRDEWKGSIITFSNLPAMLSLVQPRRLLSSAAKGGLLDRGQHRVHEDPKSSSAELLSSLYLCQGLFPDRGCMRCRCQGAGRGAAELASVRNHSSSVGQVGRQGPLGLRQRVLLLSLAALPAWLHGPSGGHQGVNCSQRVVLAMVPHASWWQNTSANWEVSTHCLLPQISLQGISLKNETTPILCENPPRAIFFYIHLLVLFSFKPWFC